MNNTSRKTSGKKQVKAPDNLQCMTCKPIRIPRNKIEKKAYMGRVLQQNFIEDSMGRLKTTYLHSTKGWKTQMVPFMQKAISENAT